MLIVGAFVVGAVLTPSPGVSGDTTHGRQVLSIYNSAHPSAAGWMDAWGSIPSGAAARLDEHRLVITGTLENQSYGCVYQPIDLDLDKTPFLEIDVEAASHHWYLLLKGDPLPNGWVKIQPDVDQTGPFQYDLRLALGLTGKQHFSELQLGVSTEGGAGGNKGQTLVINRLEAVSAAESGDVLQLFGPQTRRLSGWRTVNDDRSPAGVDVLVSPDSVTIRGNRSTQSFGMMFRPLRLDFDKYTVFKIDVASVSHHWFMIMNHPELNKGYVRIQPDCNLAGPFYYDLPSIVGLKGAKDVRLQIGVCTNEESPSVLNETLTFREISLIAPNAVPKDVKIITKKDLKFQQQIQAAPARTIRRIDAPIPVAVTRLADDSSEPQVTPPFRISPPDDLLQSLGRENLAEFQSRIGAAASGKNWREPVFQENRSNLVVENGFYRIAFSRANGAITALGTAGESEPFILGSQDSSIWKIDTLDRDVLSAGRHSEGTAGAGFRWSWEAGARELRLIYESSMKSYRVEVSARFDSSDAIDLRAKIQNASGRTFQSVSFPNGLAFSADGLDRVILPRLVGVAFKSGFFRESRQWSDPYPPAFADFAWIGTRRGALTVYMLQPDTTFQPATLDLGSSDDGTSGYFTHRMCVRVGPQGTWESPRLRLIVGPHAYVTAKDYARDNRLDRIPNLSEKLPAGVADRLNRSLFIKIDQSANVDISSVQKFIDELPAPSIFHLSSFWAGGFDKHYPDYLPPDTEYGTLDEFKTLVARARIRGMFAMPYTNPTWWNDGPTLARLGAERIAARTAEGKVLTEIYNGNPGVVVSPRHPDVIARNGETLREFTKTAPMDFLFQDQIGARRWLDLSSESDPVGYTAGLLDEVRREKSTIPLMTEGGFDRLLDGEIGFCGMTSMSYPSFKEYDDLWGKSNWEIDPISLVMAHSKVNFYQHNLSNDVLADNDAKIAWNLTHGFGLNAARTYIRQNIERRWIAIGSALHEHVLSRVLGREMTGYMRLSGDLVWSRFGDVDLYSRAGGVEALTIGPHTVAPNGFLAVSTSGDLTAGLFNRFNGEALDGRHYLIVKQQGTEITVVQPDPSTTFVTLRRPPSWTSDARIRAYAVKNGVESAAPAAVLPDGITFLYQADSGTESYRVRYAPGVVNPEITLQVSQIAGPIRITVVIRNTGAMPISIGEPVLAAWAIGAQAHLPDFEKEPEVPGTSPAAISPGQNFVRRYQLDVPAAAFIDPGKLWIRARTKVSAGGTSSVSVSDRTIDLVP